MRENQIYGMHQATARREALILAQLEYLKTRQQAMESLILESTILQRLKWLIHPHMFIIDASNVQDVLIEQSKQDLKKAAEANKIAVVRDQTIADLARTK